MRGGPVRGSVLVTVLFLLLASTFLVQGLFLLAREFQSGASDAWEAVRVRRAAVGHLAAVRWGGVPAASDSAWLPVGAGVGVRRVVRALTPELVLVTAGGRGPAAEWWVGQLFWTPDPSTRAALALAALRAGGTVQEEGGGVVLAGSAGGCDEGAPLPARGPLPEGPLHLGPLPPTRWAEVAEPWVPAAPCEDSCAPGLFIAEGGGTVPGGLHLGVLLSRGDLVLTGAAHLRGRLLVEGTLTLRDSARIDGAVDVTGAVLVADAARITGDRCALAESWRDGAAAAFGAHPVERDPWPLWGPPP